jgi:hypothetical protein
VADCSFFAVWHETSNTRPLLLPKVERVALETVRVVGSTKQRSWRARQRFDVGTSFSACISFVSVAVAAVGVHVVLALGRSGSSLGLLAEIARHSRRILQVVVWNFALSFARASIVCVFARGKKYCDSRRVDCLFSPESTHCSFQRPVQTPNQSRKTSTNHKSHLDHKGGIGAGRPRGVVIEESPHSSRDNCRATDHHAILNNCFDERLLCWCGLRR